MRKRKRHLYFIFVRYLVQFCAVSVIIFSAVIMGFGILVNMGVVYPANYVENTLERKRNLLEGTEKVTEGILPFGCSYGLYSDSGKYLGGTMKKGEREKAWDSYLGERSQAGSGKGYKYYQRKKELCIVLYPVKSIYKYEKLNHVLPSPEILSILTGAAAFFICNILLVRGFTRDLKKQLQILTGVTQKIKEQNLDFSRVSSSVYEIDEVLESMDQMREALKNSLKQQWKMEERRKEEAAAAAHDIKTPLTVIRGNSELLEESEDLGEIREYNADIRQSIKEIEEYLSRLQRMLHSETKEEIMLQPFSSEAFMDELKRTARGLASQKNIRFFFENELGEIKIYGEWESLYRAVVNLISNAVDYSPADSPVWITLRRSGEYCEIAVTDSGRGFTDEELVHAKERFYQGEKGRSNHGHYGMGLSITESLMLRQNGRIMLENSEKTGGASVKLYVPIEVEKS